MFATPALNLILYYKNPQNLKEAKRVLQNILQRPLFVYEVWLQFFNFLFILYSPIQARPDRDVDIAGVGPQKAGVF